MPSNDVIVSCETNTCSLGESILFKKGNGTYQGQVVYSNHIDIYEDNVLIHSYTNFGSQDNYFPDYEYIPTTTGEHIILIDGQYATKFQITITVTEPIVTFSSTSISNKEIKSITINNKEVDSIVRVSDDAILYKRQPVYELLLSSDSSVSQKNENITFTATLTYGNQPVSNETVTLTDGVNTLATGTTNSNGVATITYAPTVALLNSSFYAVYGNKTSHGVVIDVYDYVATTLAELQTAFTSIADGELLYIDEGEYVLTQHYRIANCTIVGNNATIKSYGIGFDSSSHTPIEISGLNFDGNGAQRGDNGFILLNVNANVHIHHCSSTNIIATYNAVTIRIAKTSADYNIEIDHCEFTGGNTTSSYGHTKASIAAFQLANVYNINVHHNVFNHPTGGSGTVRSGKAIAFINNYSLSAIHNCTAYCNQYLGAGDYNDGISESQCPD